MGLISEAGHYVAQTQALAVREQSAREQRDQLAERLLDARADNSDLKETINELQLAIEDVGWLNANWATGQLEFSAQQIMEIVRFSRLMWLKNPLINRAVNLQALYVWGQGVNVFAKDADVQAALESFWGNQRNVVEFTGHQARTLKEVDLQVTGNLFFVLFTSPQGDTVVRSIPVEEINQIVSDPEDRKTIRFYKRVWNAEVTDMNDGATSSASQSAYYPDIDYVREGGPDKIGGVPVRWDQPIYHVRTGCMSDMRYGIPETYQALEWARVYKNFLEDCASLMKKLARFAFTMKTKGGVRSVAAAKAKLATTISSSNPVETNPEPLAGSTFVSSQGVELEAVKTSGLAMSPEEGRSIRLMVGMATGTPDVMLSGDADVGNHATARTLDRPTELKFNDRQMLWKQVISTIVAYAVKQKMSAGRAVDRGLRVVDVKPINIEVVFPPILHHDPNEMINALVNAATLAGHPDANTIPREDITRLIASTFGMHNIDDILKRLEQQVKDDEAKQELEQANTPNQPAIPGEKPATEPAKLAAAIRELRDHLQKVKEPLAA